jgi:phenylpropionate dioxygenase-like ring-hydroxylating dioxygenase large terminal subunit
MIKDYWYIACLSRQLGKGPLARTICGEALVIFRDHQGRAGALIDRCLHRNMALSRGDVSEKGLVCSYHGWTYDVDGHCVDVPASCEDCEVGKTNARARAHPVVEKQGLVWVYIASTMDDEPGEQPIDFPNFDAGGWRHWFMEREFEGNAFHCVENFLDVPHTAHVHRGLFRGKVRKEIELEITFGEDWVQAEFLNEERMKSLIGYLLVPKRESIVHTDRFTLPFVTQVDYRMTENRQYIVMSQCTPVDEEHTRVFTYMTYRFAPFGAMVGAIFRPLSNLILNQDVEIIRKQTEDLRRTGKARFLYHETDAIAAAIRDLLAGKSLTGRAPERCKLKV